MRRAERCPVCLLDADGCAEPEIIDKDHRLARRGVVLVRESDENILLHDRHPGLPRWNRHDLMSLDEIDLMFASMYRARWGWRDERIGATR